MNSLPLPLAHVLADENARLYGEFAPREARWRVTEAEIIDARALAQKLAERMPKAPEEISRWREESSEDPNYARKVVEEINEILTSTTEPRRWLYELDGFEDAKKDPYASLRRADAFDPDEVFNVNREIFDGLFPEEMRNAGDFRYAEIVREIHKRAKEQGQLRTALAFSGGGIRSATYALGVLQGLARQHILEKFDFLSTISGGGYIGGWLSSWARRDPWGIRGVSALLTAKPGDPLDPEPQPLQHLRAYSSYLIPRLSIFSADTWALAATYFRNVLLNWIVLIPLLAGFLAVPRVLLALVKLDSRVVTSFNALIGLGTGVVLLGIAFGVLIWYRPVIHTRGTRSLTDGKFVTRILIPLVLSALAFLIAWAWQKTSGGNDIPLSGFLGATLATTTAAFFVFLYRFVRWPFADRPTDAKARESRNTGRLLTELGASVVAGLTGGILLWVVANVVFPEPVNTIDPVQLVRWPITNTGQVVDYTAAYVCFGVPLLLLIFFLQAALFVGASSQQNHDFDREWWARASGWVLLASIGWIGLSALTIYGPVAIYHLPGLLSAIGGGAGIFSVLAGRSGSTKGGAESNEPQTTTSKVTELALMLAVPVFVLYILALISLGTTVILRGVLAVPAMSSSDVGLYTRYAQNSQREYKAVVAGKKATVTEKPLANKEALQSYQHLKVVESTPWGVALAIALGCPLLAIAISRCIGVNVFSMHAMYRNRLVRAYLGASRWSRSPNEFTGFDPQDNLEMHDLRPEYLWWHSFRDIDNAIGLVANGRTPRLQLIHTELRHELGSELDGLLDAGTPRSIARPAFYQALNVLIATRDLAHLFDPTVPPAVEPRRSMRNRRFLEVAFSDAQVFPSPMPTICSQDIRPGAPFGATFAPNASPDADALRNLFNHKHVTKDDDIREQINEVIVDATLSQVPPFASADIDPHSFEFSKTDGVHRMIDNRLRIEKTFPGIFEPLRLPRPLHVIGMCLNLTGGEELAWQERKGETFGVTPVASGSFRLGYRDTRNYGEISLGTAVTISGAAASPNQGYNTSAPLAFLMTLFNVRLGWWLGNPGLAGNDTYHRRNPKYSLGPLMRELTGNANDKFSYIYLSDGGHFDNLGLYEMVLRRVHRIVVSDGTADSTFRYDDLGNSIRKIRIDLGVEIDIEKIDIVPPTKDGPGKYCATGTIRYKDVDGPDAVNGELLYIKPVVYQNQGPRDVLNYAGKSITFPHESTADQFFSESQFESYRRLGLYTVETIAQPPQGCTQPVESVDAFIRVAKQNCCAQATATAAPPKRANWA